MIRGTEGIVWNWVRVCKPRVRRNSANGRRTFRPGEPATLWRNPGDRKRLLLPYREADAHTHYRDIAIMEVKNRR